MSPNFKNYNKNEVVGNDGLYYIYYYPIKGIGAFQWKFNSYNGMWYESYQDLSYFSADKFVYTGRINKTPLKPKPMY